MSEQLPKSNTKNILHKAGRTAIGLSLAATAGFVGGKVAAESQAPATSLNKQAVERIISEANREQDDATFTANWLTKDLQDSSKKLVPATILKGDITIKDKATGNNANTYHNVIALFDMENPALSHATSTQLENKWFGLRVTRPDGAIAVEKFQFDSENGMTMHLDDPNNTFQTVQLYTQPSKGTDPIQLYAFDPNTEKTLFDKTTNMPVSIAFADGMK
jgi:hypothetical protein